MTISYNVALQNIMDFVENSDNEEIEPLCDENYNDNESDQENDYVSAEEQDEMSDALDEELQPRRHRKLLTWKRLVNSIDTALKPENYNPIHYINGNGQWETLTVQRAKQYAEDYME